jgi:hypothetical protein
VFIGTLGEGVYMTTESGKIVLKIMDGLIDLNVVSLIIHDDYLYAGTYGCGLWRRSINEIISSGK